jgi:hypothetical protein
VLDTGVDTTHADLASQVIEAQDFSGSSGTGDKFGHGTHVASITAGTGAKVRGKYKGVAPGAKILNGKVLDDNGFGSDSGIIAGMEWAVATAGSVPSARRAVRRSFGRGVRYDQPTFWRCCSTFSHFAGPPCTSWYMDYSWYMSMKRTNVYADPEDLAIIKEAAKRRGISEAEIIRQGIHLAAMANRVWDEPFSRGRSRGRGVRRPRLRSVTRSPTRSPRDGPRNRRVIIVIADTSGLLAALDSTHPEHGRRTRRSWRPVSWSCPHSCWRNSITWPRASWARSRRQRGR